MALIIYPDSGFNSYISVADALIVSEGYISGASWRALSEADQ